MIPLGQIAYEAYRTKGWTAEQSPIWDLLPPFHQAAWMVAAAAAVVAVVNGGGGE